jgi:hypothetical protein
MTIDFVKSALGFQNQHLKNETSVLDGLSWKGKRFSLFHQGIGEMMKKQYQASKTLGFLSRRRTIMIGLRIS